MALSLRQVASHEPAVCLLVAPVQRKDLATEYDRCNKITVSHIVFAQTIGHLQVQGPEVLSLWRGPVLIQILFQKIALIETLCDAILLYRFCKPSGRL